MRYFENLGEAMGATGNSLNMTCKTCGHTASWNRKRALQVFSEWDPPFVVRDRLKCGQCGEKYKISVTI